MAIFGTKNLRKRATFADFLKEKIWHPKLQKEEVQKVAKQKAKEIFEEISQAQWG